MADTLFHRGPDDGGEYFFDSGNYQVGLGFRRLAIIDLSATGHQPMSNADQSITLIFNGEIYNHAEIRKLLENKGYRFISTSDTEVILHAYHAWGMDCVKHFTGMFAVAIHDKVKEEFYLLRDRTGVKPLFWYHKNDVLIFGSELKSFHRHHAFEKKIHHGAVSLYFQHGYIPAPHCIFSHTQKLRPGHFLKFDLKNKSVHEISYWDVTEFYNKPKQNIHFEEALSETEKILTKACNYRMVADVPVGIFLSGGYDSSLVTALIQKNSSRKLKTFTISFEEEAFNEAPHARKVAEHLGTEHYEYSCTYREAMDIIPLLPEMYDEPFADSSALPTYLVSKMARQQVTVALSADGGDETFAGYTKYAKGMAYLQRLNAAPALLKQLAQLPLSLLNHWPQSLATPDRINKLLLILRSHHPADAFNIITQAMTPKEVSRMLNVKATFPPTAFDDYKSLHSAETLDHFLWLDYKTFLPDDILQKVDRATMAVSLEGREPLLDHHIIEWAAQLPAVFKLQGKTGKHILRHITHRYIPASIMDREKMGFQVPVHLWLKKEYCEMLEEFLSEKQINTYGLLNNNEVNRILNSYLKEKPTDFHRLWKIFMLQMWLKRWMN